MSLDGFLTFIGLMIATYAILSPVSRLRLWLNMRRQLVLGVVAIVLVGFLEFYFELRSIAPDSLSQFFSYVEFKEQTDGLSNQEAAFLVVIAWLVLAFLFHILAKPRALSLRYLVTLCERLRDEDRYFELVDLVEPYLKIIRRAVEERPFGQRFHHRIPDWIACRIKPMASLVPTRRKAHRAASEIEDLILQSDGVRQVLVRRKPEFTMELMNRQGWKYDEFRRMFFRDALDDRVSHFYKELKAPRNLGFPFDYAIDSKSVLLKGFFGDATVCEKCGIWKPVGDEALRLIRADRQYAKRLNGSCPNDEDLWSDPIYNTIHFFNIMVISAARQDVRYHMWLMYMSTIVSDLEAIHDHTDNRVDDTDEFPTLGNRLIYQATYSLKSWIELAKHLPRIAHTSMRRCFRATGVLVVSMNHTIPFFHRT